SAARIGFCFEKSAEFAIACSPCGDVGFDSRLWFRRFAEEGASELSLSPSRHLGGGGGGVAALHARVRSMRRCAGGAQSLLRQLRRSGVHREAKRRRRARGRCLWIGKL